jgi:hypothetical protein
VGGRERKTYRGGVESVCGRRERERHSKEVERVCESVRGRERIERGVEREVNVEREGRERRDEER